VTAAAAVRRLLSLVAAIALLGHGGVELAPRLVAAAAAASSAASPAAPSVGRVGHTRPSTQSQPIAPPSTVRGAVVVTVPAGGADLVGGPGPATSVGLHPPAAALSRPHTQADPLERQTGVSGRGPPAPAGT